MAFRGKASGEGVDMRAIARVVMGLIAAMLAAAAIKVLHVITPASFSGLSAAAAEGRLVRFGDLTLLTATQQALFALPIALIATSVTEVNRIRGWIAYAVLGLVVAMAGFLVQMAGEGDYRTIVNDYALRAYLIEGFCAGVVYWLVAGRFAGWRRRGALVRAKPYPIAARRATVSDVEAAAVDVGDPDAHRPGSRGGQAGSS